MLEKTASSPVSVNEYLRELASRLKSAVNLKDGMIDFQECLNVAAEIERLLADHPAIAQVAVVGLPDERMGEVGCACVVLRPGAELTAQAHARTARQGLRRRSAQPREMRRATQCGR